MNQIHFNPDYLLVIGKGNEERIVPLHTTLAAKLFTYIEELKEKGKYEKDGLVFPSRRGGGVLTDICKPLERAMKLAGMSEKIVPHMFRHAFAAHILERGGQLQTRQTLLATKII